MAVEKGPVINMDKGAVRARYNAFRYCMVDKGYIGASLIQGSL
jgi:hypothetical protein